MPVFDPVNEILDGLLGRFTTTHHFQGRIGGVPFELAIDPVAFARRAICDAFMAALPETWIHRAAAFQDAAPRSGDFHGEATQEELRGARNRCHAVKRACLRHAELLAEGDPWAAYEREVDELLAGLEATHDESQQAARD
jgi:hypothetical protein